MTFRLRQRVGWAVLVGVALLGATWLARLDYAQKISTDVLDLIPTDERSPELALVRQLASEAGARTMLFVLRDASGAPAPPAAAARFATELARSAAFDQVLSLADPAANDALGRELFERRFALLYPIWLHEHRVRFAATSRTEGEFASWLAADTVAALDRFLATPEALAFQDIVPADPLLLMPAVVARTKLALTPGPSPAAARVWARLAVSPLSEAGQAPAFAAIARASDTVRAEFPGLVVADTGVNRFAAASRARIEREVSWLNALSLAAVLAVAALFIRRLHRGLHLVPVVLLAVLGAWVAATMAFDRLHIMVFVVGSLLTGVAIDYGFYLFMQPPLTPDEDYWDKVRRLRKPLLASCLTTVAGFALLLFSDLPLIRQLGVFVGAGLVSALVAAVLYFSTVRNPFLEARTFRGSQALSAGTRRTVRRGLTIGWFAALPGLALLTWKDDIRELQIPSAELTRNDTQVRAEFGERSNGAVYLTYGPDVSAAREALEKLTRWLASADGGRTTGFNLGAVIPTADERAEADRFGRAHPDFPSRLRTALAVAGYDDAAFAPFFETFARLDLTTNAPAFDAAVGALAAKLTGPLGLLLHRGEPLSWFVTVVDRPPDLAPPPDTHSMSTDQLQSLNRLFRRYRQGALWLSLAGFALVGGGVLLAYGLRDGLRIFAIPCAACLGLFGALGWLGQPLNLFHLLGAFLGVCLTHNYSIFTATSAYQRAAPPVSVRLSALTTAASFGVLALSGIPVVRALGSTVALMVIVALLMIEFEHLSALGRKP